VKQIKNSFIFCANVLSTFESIDFCFCCTSIDSTKWENNACANP